MIALERVHRCPGTDEPHEENHETTQTRNRVLSDSFLTPDVFKSMLDFYFFFFFNCRRHASIQLESRNSRKELESLWQAYTDWCTTWLQCLILDWKSMNRQRLTFLRKQRHKSTAILANDVHISPGEHAGKAHTYGKAVPRLCHLHVSRRNFLLGCSGEDF